MELFQQQMAQEQRHRQQLDAMMHLVKSLDKSVRSTPSTSTTLTFVAFDSTSELWKDYWSRFNTFVKVRAVPEGQPAQVFLTNQSANMYKLQSNQSAPNSAAKQVNDLTKEEIADFSKYQFDPMYFIVRERFKFSGEMQLKHGENVQELAARITRDAATRDFSSITDPLDEALRTRFTCSVNNEAVMNALFKRLTN